MSNPGAELFAAKVFNLILLYGAKFLKILMLHV